MHFLHEYVTAYVKQASISEHEVENIIYQYFCKAGVLYTRQSKHSTLSPPNCPALVTDSH